MTAIKKTAVVIPAYNESPRLRDVILGVTAYGTVIVVDDNSMDDTGAVAEAAGAVVIRHRRNRGYDAAIQSGFECAAAMGMEVVVTCDADGQHHPLLVGRAVKTIEKERADMVLGIRRHSGRFSECLFNMYTRIRFGIPDILCGLKAYRMSLYRNYGFFDRYCSIGTELALYGLRNRVPYVLLHVPVRPRKGSSRFGRSLRAESKILRAMALGICMDLRAYITMRLGPNRPLTP